MPDRRRGRRRLPLAALALAAPLALALPLLLAPVAILGAEGAGASCPDATPAPGASAALCEDTVDPNGSGGAAGIDLGSLLPFIAAALVGGAVALGVALLVLRRRVPPPLAPAGPGEWWTCGSCGATNISGSPRCYSCGAWQG